MWNFDVYCGKSNNPYDETHVTFTGSSDEEMVEEMISGKGKGLQGRNVIKELLVDLSGRGHIVTTDNFFISVPLFTKLLESGIMVIGTCRSDKKYLPKEMFANGVANNENIGWIDYRMHKFGEVFCAVWKDKMPVLLLSMHSEAISLLGPKQFVYRKFGGKKKKVITDPMHLKYTRNMRGMDMADQLRGTYSCLTKSHKWWHRLFFFPPRYSFSQRMDYS